MAKQKFADAKSLKEWLAGQGVTGYAQQVLVTERFAYPDLVTSSAEELIDGQYADRQHLRPVYDAIVASPQALGEIVIQARKGYVSLMTPRWTFARIRATTKNRIDLAPARWSATARTARTVSHSRVDASSSQPYRAPSPSGCGIAAAGTQLGRGPGCLVCGQLPRCRKWAGSSSSHRDFQRACFPVLAGTGATASLARSQALLADRPPAASTFAKRRSARSPGTGTVTTRLSLDLRRCALRSTV
jgi:hypothetical protein